MTRAGPASSLRFGSLARIAALLWLLMVPQAGFSAPSLDLRHVERVLDDAIAAGPARQKIPGGVIVVTSRTGAYLIRGFGTRDARSGEPVRIHSDLFRVGSITKLFAALVLLQLVEQGRVGWDQDLRPLLPFRLADHRPEPVTVRQLLAHRAAFDSNLSGYMVRRNGVARDPLILSRRFARVRAPDEVTAYDNAGGALIGLVIEQLTGQAFTEAMATRLFGPAGMNRSVVGVPDNRRADLPACHTTSASGDIEICPFSVIRPGLEAAGDASVTAGDMHRFMLMLLNDGRVGESQVISRAMLRQFMNMDANRLYPGIPGMGLILREERLGRSLALSHPGGIDGFTSKLYLFPADGLALFISVESYDGVPLRQDLAYHLAQWRRHRHLASGWQDQFIQSIASRFAEAFIAPAELDASAAVRLAVLRPADVAGHYRTASTQSLARVDRLAMAGGAIRVRPESAASIDIEGTSYRHVAGALYRSASGTPVAFRSGPTGITLAFRSSNEFVRVPFHEGPAAPYLAGIAVFAFAVAGLALARRSACGSLLVGSGMAVAALLPAMAIVLELQLFPTLYYDGRPLWPIFAWRLLFYLAAGMVLAGAVREWRTALQRSPAARAWPLATATAAIFGLALVGLVGHPIRP